MRAVRGGRTGGAYGLVKVMRALNGNAHGEIAQYRMRRKHFRRYGQPVGFLIEKVSPAAYRLRQHKTRRNYVRKGEEAYFPDLGEYERRKQAAYHRAVYGKTALTDVNDTLNIVFIHIPGKNHIIDSCSGNPRNYPDNSHIEIIFRVLPGSFCF